MDADDPRLETFDELMPGFTEALILRMESEHQAWRDHLAAKGVQLAPFPGCYRPIGGKLTDPPACTAEDSDTACLTDRFIEYVRNADAGWFATLTYVRPHPPFVAPKPYNSLFNAAEMPAPETTAMTGTGMPSWRPRRTRRPRLLWSRAFPTLKASQKQRPRSAHCIWGYAPKWITILVVLSTR